MIIFLYHQNTFQVNKLGAKLLSGIFKLWYIGIKPLLFMSAFTLVVQSCTFKLKVKARYYSIGELKTYIQEKKYPFDYILQFKDKEAFAGRHERMINKINFMNIYSKGNFLLKASDGDNCEFKIASYIKDSINTLSEQRNPAFSLTELVTETEVLSMHGQGNVLSPTHFKILVGWSVALNNFSVIQKRLQKLLALIDTQSNNYLILGLNLDPVK